MITLKDLINREYKGRDCIAFQYKISDDIEKDLVRFQFERVIGFDREVGRFWKVSVIIENRLGFKHSFVVNYEMPYVNSKLELVCSTGLFMLNKYLAESCNTLNNWVVNISGAING